MADFHWNGKRPMLFVFIRKVINKLSKTFVQFHFYLLVGKSLNACFMTPCLIFFQRIIYFLQINLDSDWEILASINFFQLIMKSEVLLIWGSKFVGYFLISPKLLTKYGMMDWFLSYVKMAFAVKWLIF